MSISKPSLIQLKVDICFKKAFYLMWMPVGMPYTKIYNQIKDSGIKIDDNFGILE